jgi:hypothetical protein
MLHELCGRLTADGLRFEAGAKCGEFLATSRRVFIGAATLAAIVASRVDGRSV